MQSPSLNSVKNSHIYSHIYASGNVLVHPSAAVAPGVLLQADPDCCLTIAAGVCVGQGVVLHACRGNLTVETGCTLGRGVLIVGRGQIGADTCIGAFTTVWNSSIAAGQILPPNSLIGEVGRQVALEPAPEPAPEPVKPAESVPDPWATEPAPAPYFKAEFVSGFSVGFGSSNGSSSSGVVPPAPQPPVSQPPTSQPLTPQAPASASAPIHPAPTPMPEPSAQVYGQAYVERMMIAMFPHRQALSQPDDFGSASPPASD